MKYNPNFFSPKNLDDAKDIILGHHSTETDFRWNQETEFTVSHLKKFIPPGKKIKFMDFGCGIGRLSKALLENFDCTVKGVDINSKMLEYSKGYVNSEKFTPLQREDQKALSEKVDIIISAWTLQHCPDLEKEILFLKNSLVDDGILYLIDQFQRVIPIEKTSEGNEWLNDGKSVHYLLSSQFVPLRTETLPEAATSKELQQTSAIRIYQNTEISAENVPHVYQNILENHPTAEDILVGHGLGEKLLRKNELQKGLTLMELGRNINNDGWPRYGEPIVQREKPLWQGEAAGDKTLLLIMEGGIGDAIIQGRFIALLSKRFKQVHVAVPSELIDVFSRWPGVTSVRTKGNLGVDCDYWLPSYSAALALGCEYDTLPRLPYLKALPEFTRKHAPLVATNKKLKVGIRWRGRETLDSNNIPVVHPRDFPQQPLFDLADLESVQLFSLQTGTGAEDLKDQPKIQDLSKHLITWDDTMGIIDNLGLIITSCTATAHLSAAMGKPTWIILPAYPYYIWSQPGQESPWYPSVKLFRQNQPEEPLLNLHPGSTSVESWDGVFESLRKELEAKL